MRGVLPPGEVPESTIVVAGGYREPRRPRRCERVGLDCKFHPRTVQVRSDERVTIEERDQLRGAGVTATHDEYWCVKSGLVEKTLNLRDADSAAVEIRRVHP